MTVALIASVLLNVLLGFLLWNARRAADFWRRNFDGVGVLFRGQIRAESSRAQAELRDALVRSRGKRPADLPN